MRTPSGLRRAGLRDRSIGAADGQINFAQLREIYFRWRQRIKLEWHGNFWAHDLGLAEADQPPGRRSDLEITEIAEEFLMKRLQYLGIRNSP